VRRLLGPTGITALAALFAILRPQQADALTFRYKHHLFEISATELRRSEEQTEVWTFYGRPFNPPAELRVDGDALPPLPEGVRKSKAVTWSPEAMKGLLSRRIALPLDREPGKVVITSTGSGRIAFDGVGYPGRDVDVEALAMLAADALEQGVDDVAIPVQESAPEVIVRSAELQRMGIKELVAFGESGFAGSPANRRHNIRTGLNRFNGHLIPQGNVFSFVETLGPVDGTTGYLRELVIKGDRTVPDYGGGLCQVSSTAYRGAWEYGFPIPARRNHSYLVSYYGPPGTDATTYIPNPDFKFTNDSPGALLVQTAMTDNEAYFLYYGTKDDRSTDVAGPYIWDRTGPPPPRVETTADLAPGAKRVLGHAVPGMKVAWFRVIRKNGEELPVEEFRSIYQARPDFTQVGAAAAPGPGDPGVTPEPPVNGI
jgi:vancomycin resistance protein YoaR